MNPTATRRAVLISAGAALVAPTAPAADASPFAPLEARLKGGRLGVHAVDTATGRTLAHRAGERFPMASSFKGLLAGAVLARVDTSRERLDRRIPYSKADLLSHAPVSEAYVAEGALSVETLCQAAVEQSDNTAANLLLKTLGGPAALTAWLRGTGDPVTRLDRYELALNSALAGDLRDTTTPAAMAATYGRLLLGPTLEPASRQRLAGWMVEAKTGLNRLRKDLPAGWRAGDKTGTGQNGAIGDVAILWPLKGGPILVACYTHMGAAPLPAREAVMAEVGRIVCERLA